MRAVITVTELASMPGRYRIKSSARRDKRGVVPATDVRGAEAAAAMAMEYSLDCRAGYAIVAPRSVLDQIPADMRSQG